MRNETLNKEIQLSMFPELDPKKEKGRERLLKVGIGLGIFATSFAIGGVDSPWKISIELVVATPIAFMSVDSIPVLIRGIRNINNYHQEGSLNQVTFRQILAKS